MKIIDVIKKVDEWQPNLFSLEDKLRWCYEVTADVLTDCPEFKSYSINVTTDGEILPLPDDVRFDQIARVYLNGVKQDILDERTPEDVHLKKGDVVYVVYRSVPEEYVLKEDGTVPEELVTVCPAPFDVMYIDYVCAQIAFQQNDIADYNKFISDYQVRFESYKRFYGSNSPISDRKTFVNLY